MTNSIGTPEIVWETIWEHLSEDAEYHLRKTLQKPDLVLNNSDKRNFALIEIEKILSAMGKSLSDFAPMPTPNINMYTVVTNRLIQEELAYDCDSMKFENQLLVKQLNKEQREIYDEIIDDIENNSGGLFFVYGYGGTGKTILWNALFLGLRSKGAIVLNVASSGTLLAELIIRCKLIIWDEAPMMHKHCFEALDRTMRDLLRCKNPNSLDTTFGGKTVVFGGDFRQILPIAQIGDGVLGNSRDRDFEITIPNQFLLETNGDPIATIVESTFPRFRSGNNDTTDLQHSAILAPTLDVVDSINQFMNDHNSGEGKTYLRCDSECKSNSNGDMLSDLHTPEFLNGLRCSGVPNHSLTLKVQSPVMLLRNIDHSLGLCNGTRLILTRLADHVLEGQIMCGMNAGAKVLIPKMSLTPSDIILPFKFQRKQFPLMLSYAMTINKSQGQTLTNVGLLLKKHVFNHGQMYLEVSRVSSPRGFKILIAGENVPFQNTTTNVVYKEIFNNV
ncbi:ATP-dependent DNA helicase PIF1-like [Ipomoea triloba]|uniref:ATP-dependent DNA helicase PIF1-like n=1 Tax=Ipomoea triloba TaxID=35885 RepID=UPI00125DFB79|nr:ATP-dependent DNA helicase PIF1-like [Ipomoea triloba]